VAEGAPLLRAYRLIPYRGFESLALRHLSETKPCYARLFSFSSVTQTVK
jgi:hypothetical protein